MPIEPVIELIVVCGFSGIDLWPLIDGHPVSFTRFKLQFNISREFIDLAFRVKEAISLTVRLTGGNTIQFVK